MVLSQKAKELLESRFKGQTPDGNIPTLSGSSLELAGKCFGSLQLKAEPTPEAEKGTLLHSVAVDMFEGKDTAKYIDIEPILPYVAYIKRLSDDCEYYGLETLVFGRYLGMPIRGTIDFWAVKDKTLYIVDLKTGKYPVRAKNNTQLTFYAYLALKYLLQDTLPIEKIILSIAQGKKVDEFKLTDLSFEQLESSLNELSAKHERNENFEFNVGRHCRDCFKYTNCTSYFEYMTNLVERFESIPKHNVLEQYASLEDLKRHWFKLRKFMEKSYPSLANKVERTITKKKMVWLDEKETAKQYPVIKEKKLIAPSKAVSMGFIDEQDDQIEHRTSYFYKLHKTEGLYD